ncbi:MAG: LysE family translocator [Proteobacteria bacterium]|nr:LysE family translocator [Pseudomonadota bacterium]MBS0572888.1 LysE family translocator [Pseudomonadota bacterium]
MSISVQSLWLYAGALVILWITPGPVFIAITARALSGGFRSAWPLAFGVTIGDFLWPLLAIFGLTWIVGQFAQLMTVLHWVAAITFLVMGALLIRQAHNPIMGADGRLTRPGIWPAFSAGVAAVIGNPKAILFYMGVLPGFFDLTRVKGVDVGVIVALSMSIPLIGNLCTAYAFGQARRLLSSPEALYRINVGAGVLLLLVGGLIALL